MTKIMIVEDEENIALLLKYNLEQQGYETVHISNGNKVLSAIDKEAPALILLDWMLPELSGLEICKQIRNNTDYNNIPIIMLTAKSQIENKVKGLSAGADDYVTKPFSVAELMARIKTNIRRTNTQNIKKEYVYNDIVLDDVQKKVFRKGNYIDLTPTAYKILKFLIENPKTVFSREDILKKVWGNNIYVEVRTIDVNIRRMRMALNEYGPDYIRTIRAIGYSLDDSVIDKEDEEK